MATLGTMKARIASELARGSSLTNQIAAAISTAIQAYQKHRFRFNETLPGTEVTFPTVAGQANYSANGQSIFQVDYLMANIGNTWVDLRREMPETIKALNDTGSSAGQPISWALEGETIILHPVPSGVWTLRIAGIFSYPEPENDDEAGNRWMTDGELLIRCRAKHEIALHVTRNYDMAKAMATAANDAKSELERERNQLIKTGRIRPMQF